MNVITPVDGTNNIRIADFVRVDTGSEIYRFTTAPSNTTVAAVDLNPFLAVGALTQPFSVGFLVKMSKALKLKCGMVFTTLAIS
jgi:hypothetical protein